MAKEKDLIEAYIFAIPFGWLGAHHFYLGRKGFGILYACTFGLFGFGYVFDLCRMKWLVAHVNDSNQNGEVMTSDVFLICLFGGIFGAHKFYLGHKKMGILYACSLGLFGIGWIVDLIQISKLAKDHNSGEIGPTLSQAYSLGASPLGLFGAHHYYLGDACLGRIYTFTFGLLGVGWLVDLVRMPRLVDDGSCEKSTETAYVIAVSPVGIFGVYHYYLGYKSMGVMHTCTLGMFIIGWLFDLYYMRDYVENANEDDSDDKVVEINVLKLCYNPLGIFGFHHFYLERYVNGIIYLVTGGVFMFGWIFDMFRYPVLIERYITEDEHKYLDDAYIYWFPFGIFGLHHYYLEQKKWFSMYMISFGMLFVGWILDGFRLKTLVEEYNTTVTDSEKTPLKLVSCSKVCVCLTKELNSTPETTRHGQQEETSTTERQKGQRRSTLYRENHEIGSDMVS